MFKKSTPRHVGQDLNKGRSVRRIHLLDRGMEHHAASVLLEQRAVAVKVARIGLQVLIRAELGRVDEIRRDNTVAHRNCLVYQARVTLMQVAHRRHETDRQALLLPFLYLRTNLRNRFCNNHCIYLHSSLNIPHRETPEIPPCSRS